MHLVGEILDQHAGADARVLDPFCGTGTTALVCAERGLPCDTTDINPFLLWLARAKTRAYGRRAIASAAERAREVAAAMRRRGGTAWTPALHQIEKWWDAETLGALARGKRVIDGARGAAGDLLQLAFCRTLIERANVSFGHQSMSFKRAADRDAFDRGAIVATWTRAIESLCASAASPIATPPRALACDARGLDRALERGAYTCVVTSPPYPNRMSYIRELRPYMYWLGYLADGRAAGELDWQAMGGTWGVATSNVAKWSPADARQVPYARFDAILAAVARKSAVLSKYIHKYFYDMVDHVTGLNMVVAPGGSIHYVVGNSKFYDVMLPVEEIFAALFEHAGFTGATVRAIRKRTSKKELFEFVVSATKPAQPAKPTATASSSARRRSAPSSS